MYGYLGFSMLHLLSMLARGAACQDLLPCGPVRLRDHHPHNSRPVLKNHRNGLRLGSKFLADLVCIPPRDVPRPPLR